MTVLAADSGHATSVFVGSIADWIATPVQTSADKTFTYVSSSGGWSNAELVTISSNIPQNSETVSIDGLSNYIGPQTLMIAYEVAISSSDTFLSIALDQDFSGANATTFKDVFGSLADMIANPTPGSGTWSLSVVNAGAGTTVAVPPVQTLWIRDTISLSPSGSVLSISNTIVQVPEPAVATASLVVAGCGGLVACRGRRRPNRRLPAACAAT
jgi:hypothetical protein